MDQGDRIQELLEQLSRGDGATIVELLFCLSDHVLTIPAHRRAANKADNSSVSPESSSGVKQGADADQRPGGRAPRQASGPEKVRLFSREEDGKRIVPVFTSADRFLDWTDGSHQLLSLAGADLALVLGKETWLHIDPGSDHQVSLPPKSLSLLADPEKLRPLLPERYQQPVFEEVSRAAPEVPATTAPPPRPAAAENLTAQERRPGDRQPAAKPLSPAKEPPASKPFSKDELERALRGDPPLESSRKSSPAASPKAEAKPSSVAAIPAAAPADEDDAFDTSTRKVPVVPPEMIAAGKRDAAQETEPEEDAIFDSSTRAVPVVPPSLAASWKVRDEIASQASKHRSEDPHEAPTAVRKSSSSAGQPKRDESSAQRDILFHDSLTENGARHSESAASHAVGTDDSAPSFEQRIIDEEQILEQLGLALREFSDVEEAYFSSAPDRTRNGADYSDASQLSHGARSWVIGILAPNQGVENRFNLIARLAELSRKFFGEAGALEVYDDLHVESSASWRFFRSEIPFYVRERSRFEGARDRAQSQRSEKIGSGYGDTGYSSNIERSNVDSSSEDEAHWQRTARSLLLDPSAYESSRSEPQKKAEPKLKRFWGGFKGN